MLYAAAFSPYADTLRFRCWITLLPLLMRRHAIAYAAADDVSSPLRYAISFIDFAAFFAAELRWRFSLRCVDAATDIFHFSADMFSIYFRCYAADGCHFRADDY